MNLTSTQEEDRDPDRGRIGSAFQFQKKTKAASLMGEGSRLNLTYSPDNPSPCIMLLDSLSLEDHLAE